MDQTPADHGPQDAYESAYVAARRDQVRPGAFIIFEPRFTILCLLYLAKRTARLEKPGTWTCDQWATWLYLLADGLVKNLIRCTQAEDWRKTRHHPQLVRITTQMRSSHSGARGRLNTRGTASQELCEPCSCQRWLPACRQWIRDHIKKSRAR